MTKLIMFFFMVMFSSIVWAQTAAVAPSITAQIVENQSVGNCTQPVCSCSETFSNFTYNLAWSRTPAPNGYKWAPIMIGGKTGSNGFIVSQGDANTGTAQIYKNPGAYANSPCNRWIKHTEQMINANQWTVWGYLIAPNGSKMLIKSNIAQLSNPFSSAE
jgi:hypothetical protein